MGTTGRRLAAGAFMALVLSGSLYFLARGGIPSSQQKQQEPVPASAHLDSRPSPVLHETTSAVKPAETSPIHSETVAHTAFAKSYRCYYKSKELVLAKGHEDCSFYEGKAQYAKAYAECIERSPDEHNAAASAQSSMAGCPDDDAAVLSQYYNATKTAARAGDADAQLCFLGSYFVDAQGKSRYTDKDMQEYKSEAPEYVSQAFKRGDWRVVQLLATRFHSPPHSFVTLLDDIGQPETIYKMNKLLRLGATGDYAASLDSTMSDYTHPTGPGGSPLPQQKVAELDNWAQETYTQYFAGQKPLTEAPAICRPAEEFPQ